MTQVPSVQSKIKFLIPTVPSVFMFSCGGKATEGMMLFCFGDSSLDFISVFLVPPWLYVGMIVGSVWVVSVSDSTVHCWYRG